MELEQPHEGESCERVNTALVTWVSHMIQRYEIPPTLCSILLN